MTKNPLVSVCVITYNSASYIIDTLDSIKDQTYRNLELIISDDCSTDNTAAICRNWLAANGVRFVRAVFVSTPQNKGVAGNCNNAYRAAQGSWIKCVSGDDRLLPYSLSEYVAYINEHPDCCICFAKLHFWGDNHEFVSKIRNEYERIFYPYIKKDQKSQYKRILQTLYVPGPGLFLQKALWEKVGGYDEEYPFCEEHPFTYNVLAQGYRIFFIDKELYGYQIRQNSLSKEGNKVLLNKRVFTDNYRYFKNQRRKNLIAKRMYLSAFHETIYLYSYSLYYQNVSQIRITLTKGLFLLSPLFYWYKIKQFGGFFSNFI